ncbi:glycosyltransferase [Methanobacterium alcaliphilum]|uniref:glycosyltransferase n=1 Tax=Methanobacterium alcaliphilum TaxID=392018 RepID=UPI00200A2FAB|nr:glycosyltransferase [Methanobacterium alcaliphilum]MCK9152235.1 glycosyltransferase [Methanobacterium alcaliphilum]
MVLKKAKNFNILKNPTLYILLNEKWRIKNASIYINAYKKIKEANLFDKKYYLSNNPDVKNAKMDPLIHYFYHGFREGRNPHPQFNNNYYLKRYKDVRDSDLNPLVHYSLYGIKEGRQTKKNLSPYDHFQINRILDALNPKEKIVIIIPIYNAYEDAKRCIESVLKNTPIPYELILINDNSTDDRIKPLLNKIKDRGNITIINNPKNQGFIKNINSGMKISKGDVVILNSDTIVTPKWLPKLIIAAYSDERIATVTPLTNASSVSVPEMGEDNPIPEFLSLDEMAHLVEKASENIHVNAPTGNGFCMFIKRETINHIGLFDEKSFGRGYGEENDFCMRALYKKWKHTYDDSTFIYHNRSASFSSESIKLKEENQIILEKKHPTYIKRIWKFFDSKKLKNIQDHVKYALNSAKEKGICKRRILYVVHHGGGGTQFTNIDLMKNVQKDFDCFVLVSNSKKITLQRYIDNKFDTIESWDIESKWSAKDFYNLEFRDVYFNVITALKIDIIHIRHLIQHTFDLPIIAKKLGIPLIISFHDFYFICPSYNLLDEKNKYCAGNCTEGDGQCNLTLEILKDLPNLKSFSKKWRKEVSKILPSASAFVTTSQIVKKLFISIYPELSQKEFIVIEHGRDFKKNTDLEPYEIPSNEKPTKILFPGDIKNQKGAEFIKKLKKFDKNSLLDFHFMGALDDDLKSYGTYHGHYKRDNFCQIVKNVKPSFIGILSIWPETYCHTLSEAWSCGIPVLTTKIGVLEERVNKNGGGWLLELENPSKAYQQILKIIESKEKYIKTARKVNKIKIRNTEEMADDYLELYNKKI